MNLKNLHCIDLDIERMEGFRKFVSCWLYKSEELTFVVDPGPLSTLPHLVEQLRGHGVDRLDFILLTHIHIDHAGGSGALVREYPGARVICHPKGVRHMAEPEQLWAGSQKVLGALAELYGEILPVPQENFGSAKELAVAGVTMHETPGHAVHHCCYQIDDLLFGGEVAGVHSEVEDGIYLRPATPPRFILEVALDSIERMRALAPRYLVIAHYGLVEPADDYLKIAAGQLKLWVKGIATLKRDGGKLTDEKAFAWLQQHDANYALFDHLDNDIKNRERYFLGNSIKGMSEYVDGLSDEERQQFL